jgi:cytochrome c oxidase subunit 2
MPIAIEVVPQAQFAEWVGKNGGHMPGAQPAAAAAPTAATAAPAANATPEPATNQAATAQN